MNSINVLRNYVQSGYGIAKANRFRVFLPTNIEGDIPTSAKNNRVLDVFCKRATMPGKQILSIERKIGMSNEKIAYGYASDDVSLSFLLTNDYMIKQYFEAWQQMVVQNNESDQHHVQNYKSHYSRNVKIQQLTIEGIPEYTVELVDAYPTTVNAIEFSDENDGIIELSVQLSYKRWFEHKGTNSGNRTSDFNTNYTPQTII